MKILNIVIVEGRGIEVEIWDDVSTSKVKKNFLKINHVGCSILESQAAELPDQKYKAEVGVGGIEIDFTKMKVLTQLQYSQFLFFCHISYFYIYITANASSKICVN